MSTKSHNTTVKKHGGQPHNMSCMQSGATTPAPNNMPFCKGLGLALWCVVTYLLFCTILYISCPCTLEMQESYATMYYVQEYITDMLFRPAGLSELMALLVVQFFSSTPVAVLTTALIATLATTFLSAVIKKICPWAWAMAIIAGSGMVLMHSYPSYAYSGLISLALMSAALWLYSLIKHKILRPIVALAIAVILFWIAGAVAALYSLLVVIIELRMKPRTTAVYLSCAMAVWALGTICVRSGTYANLSQALTPACYYTAWRNAPTGLWAPWIATFFAITASEILSLIKIKADKPKSIATWICMAFALAASAIMTYTLRQPAEEKYARLSVLVGKGQWQEVIQKSRDLEADDYRSQNCRNLALAKTGQLSNSLFNTSCAGPQSLIATADKSPETYMTLSDIFYAIGHYSLAQKYAFEANQGLGNMSPRMLKRLAEISIITGQTEVAHKYLWLLSKTLRYAEWADEQLELLDCNLNAGVSSLSFAGINGIDADLKEIIRHHPDNRLAMDYLGMWLLASKRVPDFADAISEFYGTPALSDPLPKHFQEALAVAALATDERLDLKYHLNPTTVDHCRQFWANHRDYPNTFWHYLKHGRQPND